MKPSHASSSQRSNEKFLGDLGPVLLLRPRLNCNKTQRLHRPSTPSRFPTLKGKIPPSLPPLPRRAPKQKEIALLCTTSASPPSLPQTTPPRDDGPKKAQVELQWNDTHTHGPSLISRANTAPDITPTTDPEANVKQQSSGFPSTPFNESEQQETGISHEENVAEIRRMIAEGADVVARKEKQRAWNPAVGHKLCWYCRKKNTPSSIRLRGRGRGGLEGEAKEGEIPTKPTFCDVCRIIWTSFHCRISVVTRISDDCASRQIKQASYKLELGDLLCDECAGSQGWQSENDGKKWGQRLADRSADFSDPCKCCGEIFVDGEEHLYVEAM